MLLLRLFNKKGYWMNKMSKLLQEERNARFEWKEAVEKHEPSKNLHFKYELAALRVNKAYPKYLKAMGRV